MAGAAFTNARTPTPENVLKLAQTVRQTNKTGPADERNETDLTAAAAKGYERNRYLTELANDTSMEGEEKRGKGEGGKRTERTDDRTAR